MDHRVSFLAELKRRNVLKVGAAYLVAAWLLIQVAATVAPQLQLPEWAPRLITLILLIGFPIALILAWFLERTPEGLKAEPAAQGNKRVVGAAIVLAALAVGWYLRGQPDAMDDGQSTTSGARWTVAEAESGSGSRSAPEASAGASAAVAQGDTDPVSASAPGNTPAAVAPRSIAVLPFVNMSADPEQEFFADGLSEEILNSLARIDTMQVVGRTSSFRFKGKTEDLRAIGAKLNVASVLEGSVRRGQDTMRVTAQLIRVSDGTHIWSESYDRAAADTLAVQLDIAEHVAEALDVVLDDAQRAVMRDAGVHDVEAFIAFQKGRQLYNDAHDPARSQNLIATLREAKLHFDRATALEPDFAAAYYLATDLHSHIVLNTGTGAGERAAAQSEARRLLALAARHAKDMPTRLMVEAERQLASDDWRGLAGRLQAASEVQQCTISNWLLVGNAFGLAVIRLNTMLQQMACDPLAALPYQQASTSANWAGKPELALEIATRAEVAMGGSGPIKLQKVRALVAMGRAEEARAQVAGMAADSAERMMAELLVAAATGGDVAGIASRSRDDRHLGWNPAYWEIADTVAEALLGDRAAANRRAAVFDAMPAGHLKLAILVALCQCGAPFDLDATPNFKARIAESGLAWPPPDLISGLRKKEYGTP